MPLLLEDGGENHGYAGVLTINSEEPESYYYTDGYLGVTYKFTALPKEDEPGPSPAGQPSLSMASARLKAGDTLVLKTNGPKVKTWTSSNKKAATVSGGKVTALTKGKATITATLETGEKLTCSVNVTDSPKLSKKSIKVKKGKTVSVSIIGKAPGVDNEYKKTKKAKITSKKTASKIKIKGLKKGKTTLKIRVNGKWLKLKVKVK